MRQAAPPAPRVKFEAEAEQARRAPGVWFELAERPTVDSAWSLQHSIVSGRKAAFRPAGTFQASARGRVVLIRYVGETSAEPLGCRIDGRVVARVIATQLGDLS